MIRSNMIVEIAGTPAEHVKNSLSEYMLNLNRLKEVEVHSIKVSDPSEIEGSPGMFTCFAEADFSVSDVTRLSEIVFDFMPSSIEVLEPASVTVDSLMLTDLFNAISGRMHKYDDIAKASYAKIRQLKQMLEQSSSPNVSSPLPAASAPSNETSKPAAHKAHKKHTTHKNTKKKHASKKKASSSKHKKKKK